MWISCRSFLGLSVLYQVAWSFVFFSHINEMQSEKEEQNTDTISCLPLHDVQAYEKHYNVFGPPDVFLKSCSLHSQVPIPAVHQGKSGGWQFGMATSSHLHKNDLWKFICSTFFLQKSLSLHSGELFLAIVISIVSCLCINNGQGWMCSPAKWQKGTERDFGA